MTLTNIQSHIEINEKVNKFLAWNTISGIERYPEFMENVDDVKIKERNVSEGLSEWFVTIDEAPLTWLEKDSFNKDALTFEFRSVDGDFEKIQGKWKIFPLSNGGLRIDVNIGYSLGIPILEEVLGPVLHEKMEANVNSMLNSVKKILLESKVEEPKFTKYSAGGKRQKVHDAIIIDDAPKEVEADAETSAFRVKQ